MEGNASIELKRKDTYPEVDECYVLIENKTIVSSGSSLRVACILRIATYSRV